MDEIDHRIMGVCFLASPSITFRNVTSGDMSKGGNMLGYRSLKPSGPPEQSRHPGFQVTSARDTVIYPCIKG